MKTMVHVHFDASEHPVKWKVSEAQPDLFEQSSPVLGEGHAKRGPIQRNDIHAWSKYARKVLPRIPGLEIDWSHSTVSWQHGATITFLVEAERDAFFKRMSTLTIGVDPTIRWEDVRAHIEAGLTQRWPGLVKLEEP